MRRALRPSFWLLFGLLVLLFACSGSAPPQLEKPPVGGTAQRLPLPLSPPQNPCQTAGELRKLVPALLAKGRLDRTARVIARANRLCPATAAETWAAEVETLAELGRYAEARRVAQEIEAAGSALADARQAALAAMEKSARLDRSFVDTDEAKTEMRRLWEEADALFAKGDEASLRGAMEKFVAAWEAWRPNGQALVAAGECARRVGEAALAQRLFDRAMVDLEKATAKALSLEVPNGFQEPLIRLSGRRTGSVWP
ncbi:hypothetical protein [Sorangium sp. So ce1389]|uniref:hypothetical protein n=1 Tax=Sorangium sp. So ce1389 TaxID=3133336 RepID=UPI003F5D9BF8